MDRLGPEDSPSIPLNLILQYNQKFSYPAHPWHSYTLLDKIWRIALYMTDDAIALSSTLYVK